MILSAALYAAHLGWDGFYVDPLDHRPHLTRTIVFMVRGADGANYVVFRKLRYGPSGKDLRDRTEQQLTGGGSPAP